MLGDGKIVDHENGLDTLHCPGWLSDAPIGSDDRPRSEWLLDVRTEHDHLAGDRIDLGVGANSERQPPSGLEDTGRFQLVGDLVGGVPPSSARCRPE